MRHLTVRLFGAWLLWFGVVVASSLWGGCSDECSCQTNENQSNQNENQNDNENTNQNGNQNENQNSNQNVAVTSITFTEESTGTIAEGGNDHLAFPDVTRLSDGRLLLVYRAGASHVDNSGRIMKQLGEPGGESWSEPEVLYDEVGIDDRDPSVTVLSTGEVMCTYFQYAGIPADGSTIYVHEVFELISSDDGESFEGPTQISFGSMSPTDPYRNAEGLWVDAQGEPIVVTACSSPPVEIGSSIVLPVYGGNALNLSDIGGNPRSRISFYVSEDGGESWAEEPVMHDQAESVWLQEPSLLEVGRGSGKLLLHARTAFGASPSDPGDMAQALSEDGGETWSGWESLGFIGHAPDLYQLDCGPVLSGFREISDAYDHEWVSFVHSIDEGGSWSDPIRVADCGAVECGYPSIIELDGDRVLIVYYAAGGSAIRYTIYSFQTETEPL